METIAIYIHWPFCKSKCPYCDFNSHVREKIDQQDWNRAYLKQITNYAEYLNGKKIVSIFFGGGTPSLMPSFIVENIINELSKFAALDDNIEITLEANPTSVESEKFKLFAKAGVNRLSLGIQSLNIDNLKFLGREHNVEEAIKAIEIAKQNFSRYSFDLIYALPDQTLVDWEKELSSALKLADKHLSLYQLTIEKGTPFYSLYKDKKLQIPNEDLARDFYLLTQDVMEREGLPAYEISNHARLGEECKHNLVYWQYGDFLGIGPGAHSRINNQAIASIAHPENWLNLALQGKIPSQSCIALTLSEMVCEILLMGLRLKKGLKLKDFYNKIGLNLLEVINRSKLDYMLECKFLELSNDSLLTTSKGKLVLNHIIDQLTDNLKI